MESGWSQQPLHEVGSLVPVGYLDAQVSQMCQFCFQLDSKSLKVDTVCFDPAPCDSVYRKCSMENSMMLILIINLIRSGIN